MAKKASILLMLIVACVQAWGGSLSMASKLHFRHYTADDGVPSDCIRDIGQDHMGYMWFVTDDGVVRFDGYRFKSYPLDIGEGTESSNYPAGLYAGNSELWLVAESYLYRYNADADRFDIMPIDLDNGLGPNERLSYVTGDNEGNLWVAIHGRGIVRMQLKSDAADKVKLYPMPGMSNCVGRIYVDARGDVWALSRYGLGGLYKFDRRADRFMPFALHTGTLLHAMAMTEDPDTHTLWIGDWDGALLQVDPFTGSAIRHEDMRGAKHIHSMLYLPDGRIAIGSDEGLHMYDPATKQSQTYRQDELDAASLSDQFVHPLALDAEGGLWAGTFYGGINYLPPAFKSFHSFKTSQYINSVRGKVISAFAEDEGANIYIASDDGGLCRYDITSGAFTPIRISGHDNLHALMIDGDVLWIGSYADGVYRYNVLTGAIDKVPTEKANSCYAMKHDAKGRLWIATEQWLNLYDRATGHIRPLRELNAQIRDIEDDHQGRLWISTQGDGLYRYNPDDNDWRNYRSNQAGGKLPHNHVNAVMVDARGDVWVATVAGLCRYDSVSETFVTDSRLANAGAVMSLEEGSDALWLATSTGLVKYTPGKSVDVFTRTDGLSSKQFLPNSMLKASDGSIYVGSRNGFTAFQPDQIRPNIHVPTVVVTGVDVDNQPVVAGTERLAGVLNDGATLRLLPDDHSMTISFSSLSFVNPERNRYSYILEGFDHDWVTAADGSKAAYANLVPGKYTFRVRGSNGDNIWAAKEAVLHIDVMAPWYQRWPMRVLYVLLVCAAVVGILYFYVKYSDKKHHEELVRLNAAKELDVYHAKMSFFTMVAHEIRTPVSLIIGPLEKLLRNPDGIPREHAADLSIIERNSRRLLFLVNQLLDFKKVEEAGLKAEFRPSNVPALLRSVTERFRPSLEQNGIKLDVRCEVAVDFTADVDAELLTKLISNLMNNARKFTRDLVTVTLSSVDGGSRFAITVADNGPGLSKENKLKVFRPFYQVRSKDNQAKGGTGLGLSIVQSVVEAHGGSISVESELGRGAAFIAVLPVHQPNALPEKAQPESKDAEVESSVAFEANTRATMLIVDDNEELYTFIADSFSDTYEVITAHDGAEAMERLASSQVSLIVSDWMMPNKDGVELCREVRADKNLSHIPFVLLTAKTDKMSKVEGFNCGADAYVEKPFSLQVLQAQIGNMLRMREILRQKYSTKPLEPIQSVALTPVDNKFLTSITKIIEENFSNPELDVDLLAEKMDMSRSSMYAKIRTLVDVTPNDLIRITRLKNAAQLLSSGKYRVNEVSYMVGFSSSSYFAKCFQKQFGMTPSEFASKS